MIMKHILLALRHWHYSAPSFRPRRLGGGMSNEFPPVRPYVPAPTTEPGFRIAHALEFIAAQLAQINAKMDRKS
jgi:hypothetical protein